MVFQTDEPTKHFFALLRSGLYGVPVPEGELPERIDWKAVMTLAGKHTVSGIIIDSVQYLPERLRPTETIAAKMNTLALRVLQANLILDKAAARVAEFYSGRGIEGVLLKGQGVARYYRSPQMRQGGDVDFYVGTRMYARAIELAREHLITDPATCLENDEEFQFDLGHVTVDLHRLATQVYSPFRRKAFQTWIVGELEHSPQRRTLATGNSNITLPSYDFDAIFVFYHAWRHYVMEGIGLRQLCDWAMIFHSHYDDLDLEVLTRNIRRFGLEKPWKLFGCIAVDYLGLERERMPLYDAAWRARADRILVRIMEQGNFGRHSSDYDASWVEGKGFWHPLATVGVIAGYTRKLLPVKPLEGISLFFHYLACAGASSLKRAVRRIRKTDRTKP